MWVFMKTSVLGLNPMFRNVPFQSVHLLFAIERGWVGKRRQQLAIGRATTTTRRATTTTRRAAATTRRATATTRLLVLNQ